MSRRLGFSHRGLETMLDGHEKNLLFFLYAIRAPSSNSMHLGYIESPTVLKQVVLLRGGIILTPNTETRWLQGVFDVTLVIMVTDDEKY